MEDSMQTYPPTLSPLTIQILAEVRDDIRALRMDTIENQKEQRNDHQDMQTPSPA